MKVLIRFFVMLLLFVPVLAFSAESNNMNIGPETLSPGQQAIIPIAAFSANGDMDRLKPALAKGLESGLTINETNEILVHIYAYAGFPRSLNALAAFMSVLEERKAKGVEDVIGKEASPMPSDWNRDEYGAKVRAKLAGLKDVPPPAKWQVFSPSIDSFLKQHLFADIFARDVLDHQQRELVTVAALASMSGTEGQLRFHLGAAMNTGLNIAQMEDFINVLKSRVGTTEAERTGKMLTEVLKKK